MEPIIRAAGLVVLTRTQPPKILLLQHPERWDFPKGHLEEGEDLVTAALRETQEETGIASQCIEVDDSFQFTLEYPIVDSRRGDYLKRVTYFLGYIDAPVPIQLTEHSGYSWLNWPITKPIQANTVDPLLNQLRRYLHSTSDK